MSREESKNTLQQDLFLIAKHHYGDDLNRSEAARLACAHHILMSSEAMSLKDTLYWIVKEFVLTEIICKSREQLTALILEPGRHAIYLTEPAAANWRQRYYSVVLDDLLSTIATTQVFKDSVNLMPFEIPSPDPIMSEVVSPARRQRSET